MQTKRKKKTDWRHFATSSWQKGEGLCRMYKYLLYFRHALICSGKQGIRRKNSRILRDISKGEHFFPSLTAFLFSPTDTTLCKHSCYLFVLNR